MAIKGLQICCKQDKKFCFRSSLAIGVVPSPRHFLNEQLHIEGVKGMQDAAKMLLSILVRIGKCRKNRGTPYDLISIQTILAHVIFRSIGFQDISLYYDRNFHLLLQWLETQR